MACDSDGKSRHNISSPTFLPYSLREPHPTRETLAVTESLPGRAQGCSTALPIPSSPHPRQTDLRCLDQRSFSLSVHNLYVFKGNYLLDFHQRQFFGFYSHLNLLVSCFCCLFSFGHIHTVSLWIIALSSYGNFRHVSPTAASIETHAGFSFSEGVSSLKTRSDNILPVNNMITLSVPLAPGDRTVKRRVGKTRQ